MEENREFKDILPFREGLFLVNNDGTADLIANRCQRCHITYFPKRRFCVNCDKSDQLQDIKLTRTGALYTFTVVHRAKPNFKTPYIIGYINLEENNVRVFAPITECKPEDLKIGMKMQLVLGRRDWKPKHENNNKLLTYKFRPGKQG